METVPNTNRKHPISNAVMSEFDQAVVVPPEFQERNSAAIEIFSVLVDLPIHIDNASSSALTLCVFIEGDRS
jgi:hypothetical protein